MISFDFGFFLFIVIFFYNANNVNEAQALTKTSPSEVFVRLLSEKSH